MVKGFGCSSRQFHLARPRGCPRNLPFLSWTQAAGFLTSHMSWDLREEAWDPVTSAMGFLSVSLTKLWRTKRAIGHPRLNIKSYFCTRQLANDENTWLMSACTLWVLLQNIHKWSLKTFRCWDLVTTEISNQIMFSVAIWYHRHYCSDLDSSEFPRYTTGWIVITIQWWQQTFIWCFRINKDICHLCLWVNILFVMRGPMYEFVHQWGPASPPR